MPTKPKKYPKQSINSSLALAQLISGFFHQALKDFISLANSPTSTKRANLTFRH